MATMPIIDCDLHHTWASDGAIIEYLPSEWREYFKGSEPSAPRRRSGRVHPPQLRYPSINGSTQRGDELVATGAPAGSDYETLRARHLDPHRITRALLTWAYGLHPGLHHAAASVALCQASNDYMMDYWFGAADERIRGVICVPVGAPTEAEAEIRRVASHPQWAGVLVASNPFHKPLGHPVYHPIYKAAAAHGLPIVTHLGSDIDSNGSLTAGGLPTTRAEYYAGSCQPAMHHLASLIVEGVFEKIPTLHVLFNEYGFTWVPWVLWGLDSRFEALRRECPSLRRRPSEYFRDHVWMGSQPFLGEAKPKRIIELLECFGGMQHKICYCSDYPHWDAEWPDQIAPRLPAAWRPMILGENAARLFGWSMAELAASAAGQLEPVLG